MHPCPCCGYRTLPGRGDYDLCPVCWWEDEGLEPWEFSGPNGQTLVHAQHEYVSDDRPYRQREGKVRAPRKNEARDPGWQPLERTPELLARADQAVAEYEREYEEEHRRFAEQIAADPEGPMKEYNAAVAALQAQASNLRYREVKFRLRQISSEHGIPWSPAHLELQAHLMADEHYYRGHPLRTLSYMVRYSRPRTYRQRWQEVRTGTFYFGFAR
jgi:hypothetical protein